MLHGVGHGFLRYAVHLEGHAVGHAGPVGIAGHRGERHAAPRGSAHALHIVGKHHAYVGIAELGRHQLVRHTAHLLAARAYQVLGRRHPVFTVLNAGHGPRHQQLHGVKVVAYAVVQLLGQPLALGLQSLDVALGQAAVGVGLQPGELGLALPCLAPLRIDVERHEHGADEHHEGGHGHVHPRAQELRLAAGKGQLLLLDLVLHGQVAQALGLVFLEQAVLQLHGLAQAVVCLAPLAEVRPCLVHIVIAVVDHEGHTLNAVKRQDFVEQRERGLPTAVVHLHAAQNLVIGHERHRVLHLSLELPAPGAPHGLGLTVARAVGHGHHVRRRAKRGLGLPQVHGQAVGL